MSPARPTHSPIVASDAGSQLKNVDESACRLRRPRRRFVFSSLHMSPPPFRRLWRRRSFVLGQSIVPSTSSFLTTIGRTPTPHASDNVAGFLVTHHRRRLVRRASQPHHRPNHLEGNIATISIVAVCRVGHIKDFHDLTVIQLHLQRPSILMHLCPVCHNILRNSASPPAHRGC